MWKKTALTGVLLITILGAVDCGRQVNRVPVVPLTGIVTSQGEGTLEGVLVTAQRLNSSISVTVESDKQGRYTFPTSRLAPGRYKLTVRAVGFDPANSDVEAEVTGKKTTDFDIRLEKTKNLAAQLSDAEWLDSVPGSGQGNDLFFNCVHCHSLSLALQSNDNESEFRNVIVRMRSYLT
ncbi:MAG: carboxypeptidase-like regulatory domain-containing protein, partial [Terriglobia bacterium]